MFVELLILSTAFIICLYKYLSLNKNYFQGRNVKYDKLFIVLGSLRNLFLKKISVIDAVDELYKKANGSKIYGFFDNSKPIFLINDPELIRDIGIKFSDHFVNHRDTFIDDGSGIFVSSLVAMKDQKWKNMRSTLTPAFTGSKLRFMFELIKEITDQAIQHLQSKHESTFELNMKDFFSHFTNDIIASVAFGIKVDSLKDENNEFYQYGKRVTKVRFLQIIKYFIYVNFQKLSRYFGMKIWDEDLLDYFKRLVLDAMDYRKKNNIHRPDMINMLMEAKEANSWSDVEIVAQCFVFFLAGFETSATFLSFACHELMENSGIQKRLFEEISENYSNDELTYEDINKMTYLDAVMSETLRKWPNAAATDRQCNKTLKFENPDGLGDVVIKEGELIWIPIAGLHRDPKYFEEPKLFNPDRFSEENKRNIQPFTYIPFGVGPRACIGNRFALMMAKTILCYIIKNFELKPSPKSTIPLDLTGGGFRMKPKKGFWLNLRNRSSN